MSREIKFRQMRVDGDWMYIEFKQDQCNGPVSLDFENYPLLQYTGLKDKNGVEIYEGDIIKYESTFGEVQTECIEDMVEWLQDYGYAEEHGDYDKIEVIGNRFEQEGKE